MTEVDRLRVLDQADAELRSAVTLVADPQCDPITAMPHLRRAWQAIAWLSRGELPNGPGEDLSTWLAPADLELVPPRSRAGLHKTLRTACELAEAPELWAVSQGLEGPTLPDAGALPRARRLVAELRTVAKILDGLRDRAGGRSPKLRVALRWGLRVAVAGLGVATFVLLALRPWQSEDIGPWRAAYYPNTKFEGDPDIRREVDLAFDWKLEPPTDSIPSDHFTGRFDTCLILEEDTDAAFMMVVDDGGRLFIDGKKVVDNWTQKARRRHKKVAGKRIALKAGVHHVRAEYFERNARAEFHLSASFDEDEAPGSIPAQMLEFPGMEFDEDDPCANVH